MRTKTVFSSHSEVAHIWAQQKQSEGRASRMFFDGPSIFSYGRHFEIARFITPEIVFFNSRRYSVSTAKHQGRTRNAITNKTVFTVPSMTDHNENALYLTEEVYRGVDLLKKKLVDVHYLSIAVNSQIKTAESYLKQFKAGIKVSLRADIRGLLKYKQKEFPQSLYDKKVKAEKIREESKEVRRAEQRRIAALKNTERLMLWLAGENVGGYFYTSDVHLRIKNENIETTLGARVPLLAARELWDKLTRKEPLHGMQLGDYTVTAFDGSTLTVGCHIIPVKEVFKMARALKWANNDGASLEAVQQ